MVSTLNHPDTPIEIDSFTSIIPPSPQASRCYNTTCTGPNNMLIQVGGVWYPCDNQAISVIGFGGSLTCPPASVLCVDARVDNSWPKLLSVYPTGGPPSSVITLTGSNFNTSLYTYSVIMEVPCTNVQVINNETIIATIPGGDHFVSVADLAIFHSRVSVVVQDSRGYTSYIMNAYEIQVNFDLAYLMNLFNWMTANPLWALLIWVVVLFPFFCCCCIIYKCCCNRPKKPKRAAHHEYAHEREYYDDDYEVDDYYDVNPTAPATAPAQHQHQHHHHAHQGGGGGNTHVHSGGNAHTDIKYVEDSYDKDG